MTSLRAGKKLCTASVQKGTKLASCWNRCPKKCLMHHIAWGESTRQTLPSSDKLMTCKCTSSVNIIPNQDNAVLKSFLQMVCSKQMRAPCIEGLPDEDLITQTCHYQDFVSQIPYRNKHLYVPVRRTRSGWRCTHTSGVPPSFESTCKVSTP